MNGAGSWWADGVGSEKYDLGQTIASLYMISRAPLMHAGHLPVDPITLSFLTNKVALQLHHSAVAVRVQSYTGNCTCELEHHHYNPVRSLPACRFCGRPCARRAAAAAPPRARCSLDFVVFARVRCARAR